jgi:alpha-ketoglutarate-dependent sulfate ester dioxygenase
VRFTARLGPLTTAHPTVPGRRANARVLDVDGANGGRANSWHTDVTFVDRPPAASVLRAMVLPPFGGDTVWANTALAYRTLPDHLRRLADELWAVHTNAFDYAEGRARQSDEQKRRYVETFTATAFETAHPVVRVHPRSAEPALLLGTFARHLLDLPAPDSADLLRLLQTHVVRLEHTVRWRWQPGDVAIWDNQATQHYAIADYGDALRHMARVTIAGEAAVSLDGRRSWSIKGDSTAYLA